MTLHPSVYANMLGEKIAKHNVQCWLVNTGWTGGPYGLGQRMEIAYTRAMIKAILDGQLEKVPTRPDPIFGLHIPEKVKGVPVEVLNPRNTWKCPDTYDEKARELAAQFVENFKEYESSVSKDVQSASPNPNATAGKRSRKIHKLK